MGADPQPAFHIFLSYRREGTSAHAGRLHDFLERGVEDLPGFGNGQIFMDIDTIQPGDDFRKVIAEAVASCDVLLAVIGKQWVDVRDSHGRRRLDSPTDYVRLEIEAALERDIPVVPVLVDGAQMPTDTELPGSISALVFRNGVELSDKRWRYDVGQLLISLKRREEAALGRVEPNRAPQSDESPASTAPIASPTGNVHRRSLRGDLEDAEAIFERAWAKWEPLMNLKKQRDQFKREFRTMWTNLRTDEEILTAAYCHYDNWWCVVALTKERLIIANAEKVARSMRIEDIGWLSKRKDFFTKSILEVSLTADDQSLELRRVGRAGVEEPIADEIIGEFKALKG